MDNRIFIADCSILEDKDLYEAALAAVSGERREKALRFRQTEDQLLSLGAGLLCRHISKEYLHGVPIAHDADGKPFIAWNTDDGLSDGGSPACISLSHCWPYAMAGISAYPLGVDIEKITDRYAQVARRFYREEDRRFMESADDPAAAFFALWSRKEAWIKKNAPADLRQISVLEPEEGMQYLAFPVPGYSCVAYVCSKKETSMEEVSLKAILL